MYDVNASQCETSAFGMFLRLGKLYHIARDGQVKGYISKIVRHLWFHFKEDPL